MLLLFDLLLPTGIIQAALIDSLKLLTKDLVARYSTGGAGLS
jgi:hypothetical protein